MKPFGVTLAFEALAEAKAEWDKARTQFDSDVEFVMTRLLHEAAANYMSVEQVAKATGLTPKKVRALMRKVGLDPKAGKRLLSAQAADALRDNAALLGIEPHEMDLTSPLAYLPMGSELRQRILETAQEPKTFATAKCDCEEPDSSGSLNGGVEVCLTCGWPIVKVEQA
jgi:hypothetical protein